MFFLNLQIVQVNFYQIFRFLSPRNAWNLYKSEISIIPHYFDENFAKNTKQF